MQESTLIELQSDNWLIRAIFLSKGKQRRELWLTGWKGKVEGGRRKQRAQERNKFRHRVSQKSLAIFLLWYIKFVRVF